jgi:hypothetical protein
MAVEPSLDSVGVDNVEDFWFFDGRWTASGNRFLAYTRAEMLEAVGLSPARYHAYLDLLGKVHAYRVVRQSARGVPLRGSIFLFPRLSDSRGADPVIIFSERRSTVFAKTLRSKRLKGEWASPKRMSSNRFREDISGHQRPDFRIYRAGRTLS